MIILLIVIVVFIIIIIIAGRKNIGKVETELQKSVETESQANLTNKNWKLQHDENIKREYDKINNGEYDEYRSIEFNVVGIYYRTQLAKDTVNCLDVLCDISLIKEPDNPYDRFAVKVVYDRKRLGYVPAYDSEEVTKLINRNLIKKVYVIDSGRDYTSEFSDALFVTLRIYYSPTNEELKREEDTRLKEIADQKAKAERLQAPVEIPNWMKELYNQIDTVSPNSEEDIVVLRRLKDNIRNSIKSYEKAIRMDKESIVHNAEKRLIQYKEELKKIL